MAATSLGSCEGSVATHCHEATLLLASDLRQVAGLCMTLTQAIFNLHHLSPRVPSLNPDPSSPAGKTRTPRFCRPTVEFSGAGGMSRTYPRGIQFELATASPARANARVRWNDVLGGRQQAHESPVHRELDLNATVLMAT